MQCKKSTHTANWFGAIISNLTTFKKQRLSRTDISPKRLVGYSCQFVTAKTSTSLDKETRYAMREFYTYHTAKVWSKYRTSFSRSNVFPLYSTLLTLRLLLLSSTRQWKFVVGECISRFEALKRLLFKIFSKWNTSLVIGCNRCVFFCGMDNSEKLTFDLKISGKNKCTAYLLEWRHGVCKGNNFCACATGKLPCILLRQELFHVDKMELRVGRMV